MDFAVPADHWVKLKEAEISDKYQDLGREVKKKDQQKTMEHESDSDTNSSWCIWNNTPTKKLVNG